MVRHVGWGLTWIIASFIAILAVASVLEQRATQQREALRVPAAEPAPPVTLRTVAGERSRSVIAVSHR